MRTILAVLKRSWISHFWTNLATTAVLTLSFSLILGAVICVFNLSRVLAAWGDNIQITLYLKDNITTAQQISLAEAIKNQPDVTGVTFIDKATAEKSFEASLSSYGPHFLDSLKVAGENPFPASYSLRLSSSRQTPEQIAAIAQQFVTLPGIEDVSYGQEWLKNYAAVLNFSRFISFLFVFILLLACIFTVSNSIQASLSSRREEIEILELVGATSHMIRKPFLIEGAFQGFIAVLASLFILGAIYKIIFDNLQQTLGASSLLPALGFLSSGGIFISLLVGVGVGALGSYICVMRLNSGWSAADESLS